MDFKVYIVQRVLINVYTYVTTILTKIKFLVPPSSQFPFLVTINILIFTTIVLHS